MKKSLSRFICQKPTDNSIEVCTTAHHSTLLLVSSLIWRNTSSFSWTKEKQKLFYMFLDQLNVIVYYKIKPIERLFCLPSDTPAVW